MILPKDEEKPIDIWGQGHARYLRQYHKVRDYNLLISGILAGYLASIYEQAEDMFSWLVKQLAEKEGIN